jgi:hypothetical protein
MDKQSVRQRLELLVAITGKQFVLDEGVARRKKTNNIYQVCNMGELGITPGTSDKEFLEISTKKGYVVITKDKGFVLSAITKGNDIVYYGDHGKLHYIQGVMTKTVTIKGQIIENS